MGWHKALRSRWVLLAGAVFGAPGMLDNFVFWRRAVGDMSAGWQGALIGVSAGVIGLWLYAMIASRWQLIREIAREMPIVFWVALSFLAVMVALVIFVDKPTIRWSHPTLSAADQEKAHAECRMRAIEVVGASHRVEASMGREKYETACLTQKGFKREEVYDD